MDDEPAHSYHTRGAKALAKKSQSISIDYLAVISDDVEGAAGEDAGMSNNDVLGIAFYSFLIFTIVQTSFAFRARSSAMFADSSAMFVDSGTYLCNMLAERLKSRTLTDEETKLAPHELELRMKLHTLYLELFPPLVSVLTLMYVTCTTFQVATFTLMHLDLQEQNAACQPDLKVMMIFSALNLLLDIVNVTFFARVQQAIINPLYLETRRNEKTPLISNIDETLSSTSIDTFLADDELSDDTDPINLNMCSAWTHVFADTMRSVAVLLAGSLSYYTNLISPIMADTSAALIVSLVILLSCIPLIKGLTQTLSEIRMLRRSQSKVDEILEDDKTIEICA